MRMHRHHLLEIILWPNCDGTFSKILNSKKRLSELGIYDDWKLTITIPADEHTTMHGYNRPDGYWDKVSQSMSAAKKGNMHAMYGKKHSAEAKAKMSKNNKSGTPEVRAKISAAKKGKASGNKGKKLSEEAKAKMSAAKKGRRWFNNGITSIRAIECPPGFTSGRIYKRKAAK